MNLKINSMITALSLIIVLSSNMLTYAGPDKIRIKLKDGTVVEYDEDKVEVIQVIRGGETVSETTPTEMVAPEKEVVLLIRKAILLLQQDKYAELAQLFSYRNEAESTRLSSRLVTQLKSEKASYLKWFNAQLKAQGFKVEAGRVKAIKASDSMEEIEAVKTEKGWRLFHYR